MDVKIRTTKHRTITDSHNGSNNKQQVNNNRTTALERAEMHFTGTKSFALDLAVVEVQGKCFSQDRICLLNSKEVCYGAGPYSACSQNTV